jgi:hypothetical protein
LQNAHNSIVLKPNGLKAYYVPCTFHLRLSPSHCSHPKHTSLSFTGHLVCFISHIVGGLILVYAGVASFLYHGGMTPLGLTLDMYSVYSLVTMIIPYLLLRVLSPIMPEHFRVPLVTYGTLLGMIFSIFWPVYEKDMGIRQEATTVRRRR